MILLPPFVPSHRWRATLGDGWAYCRYTLRAPYHLQHGAAGFPLRSLDIADVSLPEYERGRGLFSMWIGDLEAVCGEFNGIQALYVENVLNERLAAFFRKRNGWHERIHRADPEGKSPCFQYLP